MDNVSSGEVLVILLVALIVLGPAKLPHAIRQAGRFIGEVRRISTSFRRELSEAMEEPIRESRATLEAFDPRGGAPAHHAAEDSDAAAGMPGCAAGDSAQQRTPKTAAAPPEPPDAPESA